MNQQFVPYAGQLNDKIYATISGSGLIGTCKKGFTCTLKCGRLAYAHDDDRVTFVNYEISAAQVRRLCHFKTVDIATRV